ncbi:MAG: long-chain fatty acid--CoA ligase [Alphaproteobacteria bacterium]|nr:long-chain fatty acid--CoA ligase [Alphaproteobacteria bacterium]
MDNLAAYTIPALVEAAANSFGDKTCAIAPERSVTFREFAADIAAIAHHLEGLGITAGDRVALLDVNSPNFLESLCALGVLRAVAVPLNYRQKSPEFRYQIENSSPRLLLASSRYAGAANELSKSLELGWRRIDDDDEIGLDAGAAEGHVRLANPHPASPFAICYTGGTTGRPKGAVIDQYTANLRALKIMYELGLGPGDVMHMTTPMFHISCLILSLAALQRGATQVLLPQFDYETTMAALGKHNVTFINTVPTILSMMLARDDFSPQALQGLRLIMYTAAPMSLPLLHKLMAIYRGDLVQFLGQTEDLPQTVLTPEDHRNALAGIAPRRLGSVGRPSIGVDLMICDDSGAPVPRGEIGEIVTRSGTAMAGYWNLPVETADTLRDGWIYSGDLGYQDADGYVYLAGRKKHMIIRGGENVYPSEVEPVLLEAPGVRDAVILGLPDETWGEVVVAAIVPDGEGADAEAIIAYCKCRLAGYRCPERIYFVEEMPINAAGKILRHELVRQLSRQS